MCRLGVSYLKEVLCKLWDSLLCGFFWHFPPQLGPSLAKSTLFFAFLSWVRLLLIAGFTCTHRIWGVSSGKRVLYVKLTWYFSFFQESFLSSLSPHPATLVVLQCLQTPVLSILSSFNDRYWQETHLCSAMTTSSTLSVIWKAFKNTNAWASLQTN